jgi:predicted small lipoprotein YifL
MNRIATREHLLALLAALAALGGCGQKGPLTLPGSTPTSATSPVPTESTTDDSETEDDERRNER